MSQGAAEAALTIDKPRGAGLHPPEQSPQLRPSPVTRGSLNRVGHPAISQHSDEQGFSLLEKPVKSALPVPFAFKDRLTVAAALRDVVWKPQGG